MKKVINLANLNKVFLIVWLLSCSFLLSLKALAQEGGWSSPINISNSPGTSSSPSLAVDAWGNVHLVWIEEIEPDDVVVMYTTLHENGWSEPIDIFASSRYDPIQNVQLMGDSRGNLHILHAWQGIQYSKAFAPEAGSARNWLSPVMLVPPENYQTNPHATITSDDQIHLVYAIEVGTRSGVYYLHSADGGEEWDEPIPVYLNPTANLRVSGPRIAVDGKDQVHVVWVETNYPETFPPLGIRYASSPDGSTWNEPRPLADGPYSDLEILAIGDNDLHVVWSGTATDRYKFHSWSQDAGKTWTDPWRNSELGGLQGLPALVADSIGRIYWLKVGTVFNMPDGAFPNNDSLHENIFENGDWSAGTILLNGSTSIQNQTNVTALVSNGNQLHTAVINPLPTTDDDYQFDIFYLKKTLDAPFNTITPLPSTTVSELWELTPTATLEALTTSAPADAINTRQVPVISNWMGVLAGLLPATLLVLIISFTLKRRKRT